MSDCVFCDIVAGDAPASFVHRDQLVSAFLDTRPVTLGHLLVIPDAHVVSSHELPGPTAERLFTVARQLSGSLRQTDVLRADGVNFFVADGEAAGQDVFHSHLHVIPRFAGDGFQIDAAAWREPPPSRDELDALAERIRIELAAAREEPVRAVRPIVVGVAIREGRLLAIEGYDRRKDERFYRSPGGGIEFGETREEALRREFRGELGAEVIDAGYLGALENVFTYEGRPGHESILVHRVELADDEPQRLGVHRALAAPRSRPLRYGAALP